MSVIRSVSLDDKWTIDKGRVVINGTQAIARVLLAQRDLDLHAGLSTAGFITGYLGSPLGNVDNTLWSISDRLTAAGILFRPGVNEDIAATAVHGTQQIDAVPGARYDGVFAVWYGKGPGVDRSCDALKHGNYAGAHPLGGVLAFYGDDHGGKSSTVAHHSEQAMAASLIPSLYPANVGELLEYGLLGIAMSRYSGSWIGIKCVNEVAEQTASIDLDISSFAPVVPPRPEAPAEGVHIREGAFNPLRAEQIVIEHRLPLVHAFVRANRIDRASFRAPRPRLGIVTAGKSYGDVRAALALLGLDDHAAARVGVSLYKVGCIWPLEPRGLADFARGHDVLLVVEEKKSFLEQQAAEILVNDPDRPLLLGKLDEDGKPLFSATLPLEPVVIARALMARLDRLGEGDAINDKRRSAIAPADIRTVIDTPTAKRSPYFCSGCPHNRSTRVPDGSISMTGIGCHTMVNFVRPDRALLPTQMGGEGGNWIGLAPFTDTPHMFQNMGDGTYYHSGLLAIRAAIAAGVNVTYKILYNDAVAMTGGQPVDGPLSVSDIARQVLGEGARRVVVLSDNPDHHRANRSLPHTVRVGHRDELDAVQRELRDTPGCTVLIYEQTCAAEKRRRRKRGTIPDPAKRLFIAKSVCESCGDCSVQSTCVSLVPVSTDLGPKRAIDQSSCNKDYSCLDCFCPSFVTIHGAEPRKPKGILLGEEMWRDLPEPPRAQISSDGCNLIIAGIGGTGVVTVGALIGMAAHLDGLAMSLFDMTGLSQKNGAVYSHVRIATDPSHLHAQRIGRGNADVLLAFDMVAAAAPEAADTLARGRTRVLANAAVAPTMGFQFDRDLSIDPGLLLAKLRRSVGQDAVDVVDAGALALTILGDTIGANLFLMGVALQSGLLPISAAAVEAAVRLNRVAVPFNLNALLLGRMFAFAPERVLKLIPPDDKPSLDDTLERLVEQRARHLLAYQDVRLAERYRSSIARIAKAESAVAPGSQRLARAVATNYANLLAYKDEYEVARLLTDPRLHEELRQTFEGGRIAFNIAPPFLPGKGRDGRPKKREFGAWLLPFLRLLALGRRLRGTPLDPFGYSRDRRVERALVASYEALIGKLLADLSPQTLDSAVAVAGMVQAVRGFGPVKEAAIEVYHARLAEEEARFAHATNAAADARLAKAI